MKQYIILLSALALVLNLSAQYQCLQDCPGALITYYFDVDGDGHGVDDPLRNVECCNTEVPPMYSALSDDACPLDPNKHELDPNCACNEICLDVVGCTEPGACNYNASANRENGSCEYPLSCQECEKNLDQSPITDGSGKVLVSDYPLQVYPCGCEVVVDAVTGVSTVEEHFKDARGKCLNPLSSDWCDGDADNDDICDDNEPCPDGISEKDECGVCGGDGVDSDEDGICDDEDNCTDISACNYNGKLVPGEFNPSCETFDACGECGGSGTDANNNSICDSEEIIGCTDPNACNFDILANVSPAGTCQFDTDVCGICGGAGIPEGDNVCTDPNVDLCYWYADEFRTCAGLCKNDVDADGVCDEQEVPGCDDTSACNFDSDATELDDSCIYPDITGVCGGNCIADADEDGVCDDVDECIGEIDVCGVCAGGGIPANDCDCFGNQLDALNDCGGNCLEDADNDGICDLDADGNSIDDCNGDYDAIGVCGGSCQSDPDGDGICNDNGGDTCVGVEDECGQCGGSGLAVGKCDCAGNELDAIGICGGGCQLDEDNDGICDDNGEDTCVGVLDDCGFCEGSNVNGTYPNGDCDCYGNQSDAIGVCGGNCVLDADSDGICDLDANGISHDYCFGIVDNCGVCAGPGALPDCGCVASLAGFCDCEKHVMDECGVCGGSGPVYGYDCDGNCLSDVNENGICDDLEEIGIESRLVVHVDQIGTLLGSIDPFVVQRTNDSLELLMRLAIENLDDAALTGSSQNLTIEESITSNGSLTIEGPATFNSAVDVKGEMTVNGNVVIRGDADIAGTTFNIGGTMTSGLEMSEDMSVGENLTVVSNLVVDGTTDIKDRLDLAGDFIIHQGNIGGELSEVKTFKIASSTGTTTAEGRIQINGGLDVDGKSTFGRLDVDGHSELDMLTIHNLFDLNATANIEGNLRVNENKFVTSVITENTTIAETGDLIVSGDMKIQGDIDIAGSCTIEGVTFSNGGMETTSMTMSGDLDVGGNAKTGWDLNVYGNGTFDQKLTVGDDFTVYKSSTAEWNTQLGNPADFDAPILFSVAKSSGDVYAKEKLHADKMTLTGNGTFKNNLRIGNSLRGTGNITMKGNLTVSGMSTFEGDANIRNIDANKFKVIGQTNASTGTTTFESGLTVSQAASTNKLEVGSEGEPASALFKVSSNRGEYAATFSNTSNSAAGQGNISIELGASKPGNTSKYMSFRNSLNQEMGRIEGVTVGYNGNTMLDGQNQFTDDADWQLETKSLNQDLKTAYEGRQNAIMGTVQAGFDLGSVIAEAAANASATTGCAGVVFYGPFPAPFYAQCVPSASRLVFDGPALPIAIANLVAAGLQVAEAEIVISEVRAMKGNFADMIEGDLNKLDGQGNFTNATLQTSVGVTYQSGSADYAEWLPRMNEFEVFEPGQIVGVVNGQISLKTEGADKLFVISTQPAVLGNMPQNSSDQYEKAAFLGQVPVRVLGSVNTGDYVLASGNNDGNGIAIEPSALKAKDLSRVVGVAWESGRRFSKNVVNCSVGMPGASANVCSDLKNRTTALEAKTTALENMILAWANDGKDDASLSDAVSSGLVPSIFPPEPVEIDFETVSIHDFEVAEWKPEGVREMITQALPYIQEYGLDVKSQTHKKLAEGDPELMKMMEQSITFHLNRHNEMAVQAMVDFQDKQMTRVMPSDVNLNPIQSNNNRISPERRAKGKKWSFKQWGGKRE